MWRQQCTAVCRLLLTSEVSRWTRVTTTSHRDDQWRHSIAGSTCNGALPRRTAVAIVARRHHSSQTCETERETAKRPCQRRNAAFRGNAGYSCMWIATRVQGTSKICMARWVVTLSNTQRRPTHVREHRRTGAPHHQDPPLRTRSLDDPDRRGLHKANIFLVRQLSPYRLPLTHRRALPVNPTPGGEIARPPTTPCMANRYV